MAAPTRELSAPALLPLGGLDEARPVWTAAAERSGVPFATWEWAAAWWRHLGHGRLLLSAWLDAQGRPRGVLPLYLGELDGRRAVRFIGHRQGDELGPVCAPGERAEGAAGLRRALEQLGDGFDVFVAHDVRPGELSAALPESKLLRREPSPRIRLGEWEGFLAARSAQFRRQLRQRERRLEREFALSYRVTSDAERLDEDMATLLRLHAARWDGRSRSFAGAAADFHREVARSALAGGWLRLQLLELDGRAVAALYNFRLGGIEWYYQAGRDPAFDRYSPGFVLMARSIREAAQDGLSEYRLLRGGEAYKARFGGEEACVETLELARKSLS